MAYDVASDVIRRCDAYYETFSTMSVYFSPGASHSVSTVDSEHLVKDDYIIIFLTLGIKDPEGFGNKKLS